MKKLVTLALAVLALAAVPAALAGSGTEPPATTPAPPTQTVHVGGRTLVKILRTRVQLSDLRSRRRCSPGANGARPQACLDRALKLEQQLARLRAQLHAEQARLSGAGAHLGLAGS